ncbi:MAG TPA: hypothetical protein VF338_12135 [Leptolinea sp.]
MNLSFRPVLRCMVGLLLLFAVVEIIYGIWIRPWTGRWGSTDAEVGMSFPGDRFIKPGSETSTRAITIHAPVSAVWPWIIRLGQERGGFFSYSFFENTFGAGMTNAEQILPGDRTIKVGDHFSYFENGPAGTYDIVDLVQENQYMDVGGWCFLLQPVDDQTTRLLIRYPYVVGTDAGSRIFYYGMFESAHFIMESGMMMGIKTRAERNFSGQG